MASGGVDWILPATASLIGHSATHADGGADEVSVTALDGITTELTTHKNTEPDTATKPHDIREVNETSTAVAKNKTVSNALAKGWEDHKNDGTAHIPTGLIALWSGTLAAIPSGWALCDGGDGRPNLLDKFVKCVPDGVTNPGSTGGASTHTHDAGTYAGPSHTHTVDIWGSDKSGTVLNDSSTARAFIATSQNDIGWQKARSATFASQGKQETTAAGGTEAITGASASSSSNPEYYEVAFIIKT